MLEWHSQFGFRKRLEHSQRKPITSVTHYHRSTKERYGWNANGYTYLFLWVSCGSHSCSLPNKRILYQLNGRKRSGVIHGMILIPWELTKEMSQFDYKIICYNQIEDIVILIYNIHETQKATKIDFNRKTNFYL